MAWKTNVVIGATVLGMAVGANQMLSVKTSDDYQKYRQQQVVEQGADAVEMENERKRDQLRDGIIAEDNRRRIPGEVRPAETKIPKLRVRP